MSLSVLPSPADLRSHEILGSLRQVFVEKGFDGASMQDLARAAGMSVGNFYRYFPSKAAIVSAMCGLDLAEIAQDFAEIELSDDPMAGLRAKILSRLGSECHEDSRLWAEITAAAIRKPDIAATSQNLEVTIVRHLLGIFAKVTGRSLTEAEARHTGQAQMLVLLVKAVAMRSTQCDLAGPALHETVVRVIDQLLNDVSIDRKES